MKLTTGWVRPAQSIGGQDHLGVRAVCESLYAQLLPGITNSTDRARYFSFYPWFVWAFEREISDHSETTFAVYLRRAECLLTLVASRHGHRTGESELLHESAMVGGRKLRPAARNASASHVFDLAAFGAFEGADSYFQNPWGGLGQYYWGTLRDQMKLLDYVNGRSDMAPGYDRVRGAAMAAAFDATVDRAAFFGVLRAGTVPMAALDSLEAFCPCGLRTADQERAALVDLFFARGAQSSDTEAGIRRATLGLLLDAVRLTTSSSLTQMLRSGAYTGFLPAGAPWKIPEHLVEVRKRWGVYQRNELLSLAVQAIFWAVLHAIEKERRGVIRSTAEAGDLLAGLAEDALGAGALSQSVATAISDTRRTLPELGDWEQPAHELQAAWRLSEAAWHVPAEDKGTIVAVREAAHVLLALLARFEEPQAYPYAGFEGFFGGAYEVDLVTLARERTGWESMSLRDWLRWIAIRWGIDRHLLVALGKLTGESRDTFRIRPLDDDFRLVAIPPAVFTSPRIGKAQQILYDLDLVKYDATGEQLNLTPAGESLRSEVWLG